MRVTVTPEFIRALKLRSSAVLRRVSGIATVEFNKEGKTDRNGFKTEDSKATFPAESGSYGHGSDYDTGDLFFMGHCGGTYGGWGALARIIRAGDILRFNAADNGNDYVKAAIIPAGALKRPNETDWHAAGYPRLYVDILQVTVTRPNAKGRAVTIVDSLILDTEITPDNSARPVRPRSYALGAR